MLVPNLRAVTTKVSNIFFCLTAIPNRRKKKSSQLLKKEFLTSIQLLNSINGIRINIDEINSNSQTFFYSDFLNLFDAEYSNGNGNENSRNSLKMDWLKTLIDIYAST